MRHWKWVPIRNLSLRSQLLFGGILILLIPMMIIGTVTFIKSTRSLEDMARHQFVQVAHSIAGVIRIPLEKDLKILTSLASNPLIIQEAKTDDYHQTSRILADLYKIQTNDYEDFAVFDPLGIVRADGADNTRQGIDISERDYFQAAKEGKASVGTMVFSKATGLPVFIICAPIMSEDGAFLGGVMAVVKANFLMKYISSVKLGSTGYAFLINPEGLVIAHPQNERILKEDLFKEKGMEILARRMTAQQTGSEEYVIRGVRKIAGFTPVELAGWSIAVTQNKDEIMDLAYTNRNFVLLISGIFLGLTVLAVIVFSRTVSTPVQTTLTTLNHAIEQATEAFVIIGLNRKIQFANPAMANIVDRAIQDIIDKPLQFQGTEKIDSEEIFGTVEKGNIWSGHIQGDRKDGSNFTMDFTITPVLSKSGKLSSFLAIGRDISNELMMQEQIRQSQKMEAIGTLAGGIAHDFNNILSAIFGYTELALYSLDDKEKLTPCLTEILNAAERARDLVNHILAFSRKAESDPQPLIPKYVIKDALKLLRASLPSTIEIREEFSTSAAILADPTQIHQITMNLCTNAGYAMKDHGGLLEVYLEEFMVTEDFSSRHPDLSPGAHLRLRVSDSGPGIPPDIQTRIFDPFFTTKPQGEGTGLGLSVVHGIVRSLNGIITLTSETGGGSVFSIFFPIVDTEIQHMDPDLRKELPKGSERILLVDDEEAIIRSSHSLLTGIGYRVTAFSQSMLAWESFSNHPNDYDAVVTDYTMPHMTGIELAQKIRKIRQDLPIIICSGNITFQEKIGALEPIQFLKKPVPIMDFAQTLRRVLDQHGGEAPSGRSVS